MDFHELTVKEKISLFPHLPGVYRYYDAAGNVIYVGKAKDLHKRVAQYFVSPERLTRKTAIMVSKIADAQYSVVDSEADALLLENNLIKQYKPKYNILLKDSKTYPWICISADDYPKVFLTRRTFFRTLSPADLQQQDYIRRHSPQKIPPLPEFPYREMPGLLYRSHFQERVQ